MSWHISLSGWNFIKFNAQDNYYKVIGQFNLIKRCSRKSPAISFLLSEHILCKESTVVIKKFELETLTHLCALKSHEFVYAFFFPEGYLIILWIYFHQI